MKNTLFSKLMLAALFLPLLFSACEKNHFKSFEVGETSGTLVMHRTETVTCNHPGTAGETCMLDINEDENNDLTFSHSINATTMENVTIPRGPSGLSIVYDSTHFVANWIFPAELEAGYELSSTSKWFNLTKDVHRFNFLDMGGDNEGYYGFRWGTNTQRRYGWIKLRKTNDTDYVIDEWAFQEPEIVD